MAIRSQSYPCLAKLPGEWQEKIVYEVYIPSRLEAVAAGRTVSIGSVVRVYPSRAVESVMEVPELIA